MYNQVTDRYRLVQTEIVKAVPVLGRMISPRDGYSLEVFREGIHIGSVRPRSAGSASKSGQKSVQKPQQMRVNSGDVIFRVSLVPQSIPIVGSFTTSDNCVRIYDMTLDLVVSDPVLFVQGYHLGKDPVHLAIESFKSAFLNYATKTEHDKLKVLKQPGDVWNNSLSADTGMRVAQISQCSFRDDPKRLETAALQQDAEKNKLALKIKGEIQKLEDSVERERDKEKREHERHELGKQKEFEREEETLQQMHQLHKMLRATAAQEFTDILRERIRETFEGGRSISEVAEDSLKLLDAFHESLRKENVVDSTLAGGHSSGTNDTSSGEDTSFERDLNTDPAIFSPPNLKDLSGTEQKKDQSPPLRPHRHPRESPPRRLRKTGR